MSQYLISVPAELWEDEEAREQIYESFVRAIREGQQLVVPEGITIRPINETRASAQMDRLLALLALTPEERGFVQAALTLPGEGSERRTFFAVLADYLEEKQDPASARFRAGIPAPLPTESSTSVDFRSDQQARLRITWDLLVDILAFPQGTHLVDARMDHSRYLNTTLELLLASSAFPSVPEGAETPVVGARYVRVQEPSSRVQFAGWELPQTPPE